jgi:hypothetical protein
MQGAKILHFTIEYITISNQNIFYSVSSILPSHQLPTNPSKPHLPRLPFRIEAPHQEKHPFNSGIRLFMKKVACYDAAAAFDALGYNFVICVI